MFLCFVLVLYGYIQPYKTRLANALEITVQLIFLFILLMVSSQLLEQFFAIPFGPGNALSHNSSGGCVDGRNMGVAPVTWILTPFYYLPLLVLIAGVFISFVRLMFRFV